MLPFSINYSTIRYDYANTMLTISIGCHIHPRATYDSSNSYPS